MVISKLHIDKITKHLSMIQEFVEGLRSLAMLSNEDFFSDKRNIAAAESYLRRCLECIFDIGRHIMAKSYGLKDLEYKKIANNLGEKGVISEEYSEILGEMAGYRNRMVHLYYEISKEELYGILQKHLSDLERFVIEITYFIERYEKALKEKEGKQ